MAGQIQSKKRKCLMTNENNKKSRIMSSANSLLLKAAFGGRHCEVARLLGSSFDQMNAKTLEAAFFQASERGHKRVVQFLIQYGINVNSKNSKGYTALMASAERGFLDIVKLLVKNGAHINTKSKNGKSALMLAVEKACCGPLVEFLLSDKCNADVNTQDREGKTALMISVQLCDIAAMRILINHKADITLQNNRGYTAFDVAKQNNVHEEFCILNECIGNNLNPLMVSVIRGSLTLLKAFLDDDYYSTEQTNIDGYTPLFLALINMTRNGHHRNTSTDFVLTLIKNGADVNKMCNDCSPLLYAIEFGNLETVKFLVEHRANINAQTPVSKTSALMISVQKYSYDVMEFLLKKGADLNLRDNNSKTALTYALIKGEIRCVDQLARHGAQLEGEDLEIAVDFDLDKYLLFPSITNKIAASSMCMTLVMRCLDSKNYSLMEFLLDHGAGVHKHLSFLLFAAVIKDACMAKIILDRDAAVNELDDSGYTALMGAARCDNKDAVKLLIERGADMKLHCNGKTALDFAIMHQARNAVEALLDRGVDIDYGDKDGKTPLMVAVNLHDYDIICLLLANGANLDKKNCDGSTALHIALSRQDIKAAEMVISAGADVNVPDNTGKTALMICSQSCTTGIMLLLLQSGANVNAADEFGFTAFHYAVKHSIHLTEKAEILLKHGADINKTNNSGETAFMLASKYCKDSMLKLLFEHGADINAEDNFGCTALMHALKMMNVGIGYLISIGSDVNVSNYLGTTPLWIAATTCNDVALKALISAGADVSAVVLKNCNVFTFAIDCFNNCHHCIEENSKCNHCTILEILAKTGAKPVGSKQCLLALCKAIAGNKLKLVQLLVECGIAPFELSFVSEKNFDCLSPVSCSFARYTVPYTINTVHQRLPSLSRAYKYSPLSMAILCNNEAICQYFIRNNFLNKNDMNQERLHTFCKTENLGHKSEPFSTVCKEIFSQPWSLTTMSFVAVSSCINNHQDRERRIRSLPIPLFLQDRLLFINCQ